MKIKDLTIIHNINSMIVLEIFFVIIEIIKVLYKVELEFSKEMKNH
jgi:hypothetical protein